MVPAMNSVLKWLASLTLIERESTETATKVTRVKFGTVIAIALAAAALVVGLVPSLREATVDQVVNVIIEGDVRELVTESGGSAVEPEVPEAVSDAVAAETGTYFEAAPAALREAIVKHFPEGEWETAAEIAWCESGFRADAHNLSEIEDSRGYFQINVRANTDMTHLDLWSAEGNTAAAAIVWERQGWSAWKNCATKHGIIALPRAHLLEAA